jgi:hypothetical protein
LKRIPSNSFEIHDLPFIASFGGVRLTAICKDHLSEGSRDPLGREKTLTVDDPRIPTYVWKQGPEGWEYLSRLIDGLISATMPCHHYLTKYPEDDALVVVSKGEYSDKVLSKYMV